MGEFAAAGVRMASNSPLSVGRGSSVPISSTRVASLYGAVRRASRVVGGLAMKLRPSRRCGPRVPDRMVAEPGLDASAYRQLRRAESARIREVGDLVALGCRDAAQQAFVAAIAINQELHVPDRENKRRSEWHT